MSVFHSGMSLFSLFCAFLFHQYWHKYTSTRQLQTTLLNFFMCQYPIVVFAQIQLLLTDSLSSGPSESHLPTDLFLVTDQSYGIHCQNTLNLLPQLTISRNFLSIIFSISHMISNCCYELFCYELVCVFFMHCLCFFMRLSANVFGFGAI